ncbi:LysR family transcriptional regulator [Nocardioides sp.]|uniref:LysR family transcriptional regulator n=1 Tax=Nocardioides sp. TaxID=35761 RepID=UPI0039E312E2
MGARTVDLNLLEPLDALLRERSVTAAARRTGVTQPAMSASLAKLRRHFDDAMLVRVGNRYRLTPFAEALRPQVERALADAHATLLSGAGAFDPRSTEREFAVLASDYAIAMLGPRIVELLRRAAPRSRLAFSHFDAPTLLTDPRIIDQVDGLILPHGYITEYPYAEVFGDRWVCLVAHDNSAVGEELSLEVMKGLTWIRTYRDAWLGTVAERQLRMQGVELRTGLISDSFLSLPFLVAGSDMVALVPSRLARQAARAGDVRVLECPVRITGLNEALWWHPSRTGDPAHSWLRRIISAAGRGLSPTDEPTGVR